MYQVIGKARTESRCSGHDFTTRVYIRRAIRGTVMFELVYLVETTAQAFSVGRIKAHGDDDEN